MSASSVQQTEEKREAVNDAKPLRPPIKPKPTVPPKPKQAYVSTNSEIKSPLLSPNSGGPCSPTFDIPSAFKISQLTGPQPYGARRTSLKRWSSSVGEEVPLESNSILSPVENVVPELSTKVTNQPLAANLKHLQTGSAWKGKSPFMLTTRGWGEQKNQGKDIHESASFPQKHGFSSACKDSELKQKETISEGNAVINSNSPVQDPKQSFPSVSEDVDKPPFGLTSSGKIKREMPAKDNEMKSSQETTQLLSVSPQTDVHFGPTKQSTQYEHNQDTKAEDFSFSYTSDEITTESPKDIDEAFKQMKNTSLRTKDYEEPQLISLVPTAVPKPNIIVKQSTDNAEKNEECPLYDMYKSTSHKVTRHHEDHTTDISVVGTVVKEEQDADSGHLQTSQSQMATNKNTEQTNLGKFEQVEKHAISSVIQITDTPVKESEIDENVPLKDTECIEFAEQNLLHTAEHCDLHEGKKQVSSDNNKPYICQEDKKTVALLDMEPPVCTVKSYEIFSEEQQNTCTEIHEHNIEEEQDQFKNRQDGYNTKAHHEEYLPHQTSKVSEKHTEYPSEYRSVFGTDAKSCYGYNISSSPELHECEDSETPAKLNVASPVPENDSLIPGEVYSHLIVESNEPLHSYMETDIQPRKPQEELSQLESQETSKPDLHYDKSEFTYSKTTSQEPAGRVTKAAELNDDIEQLAKLEYYTAQSPKQSKCEDHLDNVECRVYDSHMPQYNQGQSHEQDCIYTHKVELDDKQSHELVHTHRQSQNPDYTNQHMEKIDDKCEQSDKPNYMYEQLEESVQISELSRESEGSDLKYEQTEGSGQRYQEMEYSVNKIELLKEPEENALRDDQSEEHVYAYTLLDKTDVRHGQSEHLLQSYPQLGTIDQNHQQSDEPVQWHEKAVQGYVQSEDVVNKNEQFEELQDKYIYLEETDHKYVKGELPGQENEQLHKLTDTPKHIEQPFGVFQTLEEHIHKYEEPVSRYEHSEKIIHNYDQSQTPDNLYKQHDEPVHCFETVNQYGQTEDSGYIQTGSDDKNVEYSLLVPHQEQYKPIESEEIDSKPNFSTSCDKCVECSEKDITSKTYVEQQLNDSHMEESEHKHTSIDGMHDTEPIHKCPPSDEQLLLNVHTEEAQQSIKELEKAQNVDGLSEGSPQESPTFTKVASDESMPEKTQDQEDKMTSQILNGHGEHGEFQTAESISAQEFQTEEPDISEEKFEFLEGTVVLDSSLMRGRASLGKKRGHRTPAGTCGSEEKDPEYWMFRDSTEPKTTHLEEEDRDETSPDAAPDNSPSPVKSPSKKGIFAGIMSPSLLKGRLKTRSKTTEDETVKPEVEEAKSPGKEKGESSGNSLNWLYALKKKKKSIKETTKEEKKKASK